MKNLTFAFFLACLVSCGPSSLQDLRCEADSEMKKLAKELEEIKTKDDLQNLSARIKKKFTRLGLLLVETRKFAGASPEPSPVAEALFAELARLYEIPGARETIENLQEEAVHLLDKL